MNNRIKKAAVVMTTAVILGGAGIGAVSAQGPGGQPGAGGGPGRGGVLACSATNYTDVAAKALGMESAALRLALASGKTLTDIASSQQVSLQTVQDALKTAYGADLDQALKDGLITQQMYDQLKSQSAQTPSNA